MMAKAMNTTKKAAIYIYPFVLIGLCGIVTFTYAAKLPENILNNGDFDLHLQGWHHWTHESANALFQTEGKKAEPIVGKNVAYIKINKVGNALGHIQLYQQPFTLLEGTTYTYSLWAKSEKTEKRHDAYYASRCTVECIFWKINRSVGNMEGIFHHLQNASG